MLYVTNLPFSMEDEGLTALFAGHNIKSAKVVKTKSGRSRGYGFVDCADNATQKAAMDAVHGKDADGREVSVKVAKAAPVEEAA